MKIRAILGASILLLVSVQVNAALMVNSWDLMVLARDEGGVPSTIVNDNTVSNIFSETRTATQGETSATTAYDFAWDAAGQP